MAELEQGHGSPGQLAVSSLCQVPRVLVGNHRGQGTWGWWPVAPRVELDSEAHHFHLEGWPPPHHLCACPGGHTWPPS